MNNNNIKKKQFLFKKIIIINLIFNNIKSIPDIIYKKKKRK